MKKHIITLLAGAMMTSMASAGGFGIYGAEWDTDDFGDTTGIGGKLILGDAPFALEIRGTYFADLTESYGHNSVKLKAIPVETGLLYSSPLVDRLDLNLGAGLGYYFLDSNYGHVDDEIGFYASGGLSFYLTPGLAVVGEGIYRWVNGSVKNDDFGDFDSGTDFDLDGFGINIGLVFH